MPHTENFLHTTHRTITWFNKAFQQDELVLKPPFQRNAVWTTVQKSYLIDTVLHALPIPELYMQDTVTESGEESHIVVDGQQRIRSVLEFVSGNFRLEGDDIAKQWRGRYFGDLSTDERKSVFTYKFVVRILPPLLGDEDIRAIFARLNKNVVALTDQEIRNATYWGPFIKSIQYISDNDSFWANNGIFSANDHRRMLDHEYISELAIAYLHGPQNKKDKLDFYYRLYEEGFENEDLLKETFSRATSEIGRLIPRMQNTRWKKKSDFYTLFLAICDNIEDIQTHPDSISGLSSRIMDFGNRVDSLLRLEEADWGNQDRDVVTYARNVARAASDRGTRIARAGALSRFVFHKEVTVSATDTAQSEIEKVLFGENSQEFLPSIAQDEVVSSDA